MNLIICINFDKPLKLTLHIHLVMFLLIII